MKEKKYIVLDGEKYPYQETCGAIIDLKEEFGKEVTDIAENLSGTIEYAYCCTRAACRKYKHSFEYDFKGFADALDVEDLSMIGSDERQSIDAKKK